MIYSTVKNSIMPITVKGRGYNPKAGASALLHIDACPIEGFDHAKVNKLLGLHDMGIESRIMVAIGYRPEKAEYSKKPKLRWPKEEVVLTI